MTPLPQALPIPLLLVTANIFTRRVTRGRELHFLSSYALLLTPLSLLSQCHPELSCCLPWNILESSANQQCTAFPPSGNHDLSWLPWHLTSLKSSFWIFRLRSILNGAASSCPFLSSLYTHSLQWPDPVPQHYTPSIPR